MTTRAIKTVRIAADLGIHLRAAGVLVQIAGRFSADIWIEREGTRANGKSIMSVLALAAGKGAELTVIGEGSDAVEAVDAIVQLVEDSFIIPG